MTMTIDELVAQAAQLPPVEQEEMVRRLLALRGQPQSRSVLLYVSVISIGKLYQGAHHSQSAANELLKITRLLNFATVLVCDAVSAEQYRQVKYAL